MPVDCYLAAASALWQRAPLADFVRCCLPKSGNIAAFLFRMARVLEHGPTAPVVDRPDQWWAVPHEITTSGAPPL